MERKTLIVANWKMNPTTLKEAEHLFATVRRGVDKKQEVEVVFCPPFVWLHSLVAMAESDLGNRTRPGRKISFGSQDCFWEGRGAYTSQISPLMLKNMESEYVIIGHSERRRYSKESDEIVNKKIRAALKHWLRPILCIGEEARDAFDSNGRELGETSLVIAEQLEKDLSGISASQVSKMVIAYEPVWAIGTGNACSPDDAMKSALFIRKTLAKLYGRPIAEKVQILYGGSANSRNAASYVKDANLDGLLIGGASLNASEFVRLIGKVAE